MSERSYNPTREEKRRAEKEAAMQEQDDVDAMIAEDRDAAILWAREVLADERTVILDSETTGLYGAEFVEVAVIDTSGAVLFESRVKPSIPIEEGATAVHGIRKKDLRSASDFLDIYPKLALAIETRRVIVYNASFDGGIWDCMISWHNLASPARSDRWECAMQRYAQFVGEWSEWHGSYTWQRLPGGDHTAVGNCWATLALLQEMAGRSS